MTEEHIRKLLSQKEKQLRKLEDAVDVVNKLEQKLRDLRDKLDRSLAKLFKENPKYYCPKCKKPLTWVYYFNSSKWDIRIIRCCNCSFSGLSNSDMLTSMVDWFNHCNNQIEEEIDD